MVKGDKKEPGPEPPTIDGSGETGSAPRSDSGWLPGAWLRRASPENRIALVSALIALIGSLAALGGLWYQRQQIDQADQSLKLSQESQRAGGGSQARELVAKANELLATGVQAELRHLGDPLGPLIPSQAASLSRGCELSPLDRSMLKRAADLLAGALELDPDAPAALEMGLRAADLLSDDSLVERIERAATRSAQAATTLQARLAGDAARLEHDQVLTLVSQVQRLGEAPEQLTIQAAVALRRLGRDRQALELLGAAHAANRSSPRLAHAYLQARFQARYGESAEMDQVVRLAAEKRHLGQNSRPHFELLEYEALVAKHEFARAHALLRDLRRQTKFAATLLPYPWSLEALENEALSPRAELDELDRIAQACPAAEPAVQSRRAMALAALGRCEEALVAMARSVHSGAWTRVHDALLAPPAQRRGLLEAVEDELAAPTPDTDRSGIKSDRAYVAALLWSASEKRKAARAAAIADGIEEWLVPVEQAATRTNAGAADFLSELRPYPPVLRDYARARTDPARSTLAAKADKFLRQLSTEALGARSPWCALAQKR